MTTNPLPNSAELPLAEAIRLLGAPGFEPALQHLFHCLIAHDNLAILIYRQSGPPQILYTQTDQPQVFAQLHGTYTDGAYLLDPFYDLHLRRVPEGSYRLRDIAPDAFQRSRYFLDYYDQTTLVDEIAFVAYPLPGVSLNICLGRDKSSAQPFAARQIEVCQRLAPVLTALVNRHWSGLTDRPGPADDTAEMLIRAAQTTHAIRLSRRQAEVAMLILRGHSSVSVALRLGVSAQTVKVFRKQLYGRCSISSQAELFAMMLPLLKGAL